MPVLDSRALDLMAQYEDHPMDFADASLVAAAESLRINTIFTLDRTDFTAYRPRIGRMLSRFRMLQAPLAFDVYITP